MPAAVHLIFGDEYLASAKARELIKGSVPDPNDPLAVETLDAQRETVDESIDVLGRCREALGTLGFFGGGKVVWLRGVTFLGDTPAGRSEQVKAASARLGEMLQRGLPGGVVLIITAARVDKRLSFFKLVKELGTIHDFQVPEKSAQASAHTGNVVDAALAQAGITMDGAARHAFLERVGGDARTILSELGKLATYVGSRKRATKADVDQITSTSRDAISWDVQDALGKRDLGTALAVLRRLLFQRESPMMLINLIETRLRDLSVYREALDQGWLRMAGEQGRWAPMPDEARALLSDGLGRDYVGMHPYRLGLLAAQARNFTRRELARATAQALAAHRQLVSSSLPQPLVLELLLVRILARPQAARKPPALCA